MWLNYSLALVTVVRADDSGPLIVGVSPTAPPECWACLCCEWVVPYRNKKLPNGSSVKSLTSL